MDVLRLRQSTRTDMRRLWNDCRVVVSLGGGGDSELRWGFGFLRRYAGCDNNDYHRFVLTRLA